MYDVSSLASRLTALPDSGYALECQAEFRISDAHRYQHGPSKPVSDKATKSKKKAKSKAGVKKNQSAVPKVKPAQNAKKANNHSDSEVMTMKKSNFSNNLAKKALNWVISATIAVMSASSTSPAL